ncbi:MAG: GNAT family N-acetyltransferase [Terriglobales bacterium]
MLHCDADLAPLAPVWHTAERVGAYSVFQSFAFARHWAACFGTEAEISIGWSAAPPIIVPLVRRHQYWSLLGEGLFDYQDLVGPADGVSQAEAAAWAAERVQTAATFTGVPASSAWRNFWHALGLNATPFAAVPLRPAGDDSLAQEHARLERRWQKAHVQLCCLDDRLERRRALTWLLQRKAEALAAKGQDNVLGETEYRWMVAMVEHEAHTAELWQLRRAGAVLAGLLCWRTSRLRYAYTIAYDPAAAALSPGILALYALLRQTMREGRIFSFLTGEQAFKQRFATQCDRLLRYQNDHASFQS